MKTPNKIPHHLAAVLGGFALILSAATTHASDAYIEWATITPSGINTATPGQDTSGGAVGTLAGSGVSAVSSVSAVTLTVQHARLYSVGTEAGVWSGGITNNSGIKFDDQLFTPHRANLDEIALGGNSDFTIVFNPPVTDPVLHIYQLEGNRLTFTAGDGTTTVTPTKVSGNLPLAGNVVFGGPTGVQTNSGSFKFAGTISSIRWASDATRAEDGFRIQVSVPVNVDCCCTPPDANNDTFNYGLEHPSFPLQLNVLGNDTEPNALPMTIVNVFPPELATISANGQSLQFTPDADFTGTASVWYEVSNGTCSAWAVATVRFDNQAPIAVNDYVARGGYTASTTIDVAAAANDIDSGGDQPKLKIVSYVLPPTGSVFLDKVNNLLRFTCNNGFTGQENFTYTVSDGFGGTSSARVFITAGRRVIFTGPILDPVSGERFIVNLDLMPAGRGTVQVTGKYGKILQGAAIGLATGDTSSIKVPRKGLPDLKLTLKFTDGVLEATLEDGAKVATGPLEVTNPIQSAAYYTFAFNPPGVVAPDLRGHGWGGIKVLANGSFTVVGGLFDGKTFSASGTVGSSGSVNFLATGINYASANTTGSLIGLLNISTGAVSGQVIWDKPAQSSGGYPLAAALASCAVTGNLYTPPATGQLPLAFTGNAIPGPVKYEFNVPAGFTQYSLAATLPAPGTSFIPSFFTSVPGKLPIKVNKTTGFFGGSGSSSPATLFGKGLGVRGVLIQGTVNKGLGNVVQKPLIGSGNFEIQPQ